MSTGPKVICAFDIGIKNLAFCIFDCVTVKPRAWNNVNILPEVAAATTVPSKCNQCKMNAKFTLPSGKVCCKRHLGTVEALTCGSTVAALKAATQEAKIAIPKGAKKEDLMAALGSRYALPLTVKKEKKIAATHQPMAILHDGILKMITDNWEQFKHVERFALENQPVLKNPTMKTVQILLYASLRAAFIARGLKVPAVDLVHAGKKVKGIAAGDEGYADRKAGSEIRAAAWLKASAPTWLPILTDAKKKSDLADALCMCLDISGL
jgi:hypothetical protein